MIKCPVKNLDGSCPIIEELTGKKFEPNPEACKACSEQESRFDLNRVTGGMSLYVCKRDKLPVPPIVQQAALGVDASPIEGPGTELRKLIPKLLESESCDCRGYARKMNRWGVKGCIERKDRIVYHLVKEAKKLKLLSIFGSTLPRVAASRLVGKAIQRAKDNEDLLLVRRNWKDLHPAWFVGITTAPRNNPTLERCVRSVRRTGWEPVVFAEPGSIETTCETVANEERLGVWHNWYAMAKYALGTGAKYIVTLQDDIVIHPDTFEYAAEVIDNYEGFLSLYTSKKYGYRRDPGIIRIRTKSLWGACALIFHREALEQVVTHPIAKEWLGARPKTKCTREATYEGRRANPHKVANSDTAIGKCMNARKLPMWTVNPSPARHIATHSTISHGGNQGRRNCSPCCDYSRPLKHQVEVLEDSNLL